PEPAPRAGDLGETAGAQPRSGEHLRVGASLDGGSASAPPGKAGSGPHLRSWGPGPKTACGAMPGAPPKKTDGVDVRGDLALRKPGPWRLKFAKYRSVATCGRSSTWSITCTRATVPTSARWTWT